jgi:AraC family ethanolamine operon transcriptional activator
MLALRSNLPPHIIDTLSRTEAYVWTRIDHPPALREVGAAIGCSVRTLNYYFREAFGMSPIAYFRDQRLQAVRRRLQDEVAADGPLLVIDVAMEHGFWHLGHFSRAYRARFGETPSVTLANSRSQFLCKAPATAMGR